MSSALITDPGHPAAAAVRARLEALGYTVFTGGDLASPEAVRASVAATGPVDVLLFLQKVEFDDTGFPQLGMPELAPVGLDTIAPSGEPDLIQWLTTNH